MWWQTLKTKMVGGHSMKQKPFHFRPYHFKKYNPQPHSCAVCKNQPIWFSRVPDHQRDVKPPAWQWKPGVRDRDIWEAEVMMSLEPQQRIQTHLRCLLSVLGVVGHGPRHSILMIVNVLKGRGLHDTSMWSRADCSGIWLYCNMWFREFVKIPVILSPKWQESGPRGLFPFGLQAQRGYKGTAPIYATCTLSD